MEVVERYETSDHRGVPFPVTVYDKGPEYCPYRPLEERYWYGPRMKFHYMLDEEACHHPELPEPNDYPFRIYRKPIHQKVHYTVPIPEEPVPFSRYYHEDWEKKMWGFMTPSRKAYKWPVWIRKGVEWTHTTYNQSG